MAYMTVIELKLSKTEGQYYLASHPELPGCLADGIDTEAAEANLDIVREDYLAHLKEFNLPIPEPFNLFPQPAHRDTRGIETNELVADVAFA